MFSYLPIPSFETRPQRALAWQPAEWGQAVQRAQWYRLSSFSYCAVGLLTLFRPEPFQACAPFFPTRTMGASIFVNGLFSYMGDVATWGWHSFWKTADVILATINTLVQVAIVVLGAVGVASFPLAAAGTLAVSIVVALGCKFRAGRARRRGDCDAFLFWHSAWHYTLPLGAAVGSQLLLTEGPWGGSVCQLT